MEFEGRMILISGSKSSIEDFDSSKDSLAVANCQSLNQSTDRAVQRVVHIGSSALRGI